MIQNEALWGFLSKKTWPNSMSISLLSIMLLLLWCNHAASSTQRKKTDLRDSRVGEAQHQRGMKKKHITVEKCKKVKKLPFPPHLILGPCQINETNYNCSSQQDRPALKPELHCLNMFCCLNMVSGQLIKSFKYQCIALNKKLPG